jgi:hypothetical protein
MPIVDPFDTQAPKAAGSIVDPFESTIQDPMAQEAPKESPLMGFSDRARKQFETAGVYDTTSFEGMKKTYNSMMEDQKGLLSGKPEAAFKVFTDVISMPATTLNEIAATINAAGSTTLGALGAAFKLVTGDGVGNTKKWFNEFVEDTTVFHPKTDALKVAFDVLGKGVNAGAAVPSIGFAEASRAWKESTGKKMTQEDYDEIAQGGIFLGNMAAALYPVAKGVQAYRGRKPVEERQVGEKPQPPAELTQQGELPFETTVQDVASRRGEEVGQPDLFDAQNMTREQNRVAADAQKQSDIDAAYAAKDGVPPPKEGAWDAAKEQLAAQSDEAIDAYSPSQQSPIVGKTDKLGSTGFGRGQRGSVDPNVFAEAFAKLFGISDDAPTKVNASGESAASAEAISRLKSQNDSGIKIYEVDPLRNQYNPLVTADRVDKRAGQGKAIVQMDADGKVTVIENNSQFANEALINRSKFQIEKQPLGGTGKKGFGQGGAVNLWGKTKPEVEKVGNTLKDQFKHVVKDWDARGKIDERAIMQGENLLLELAPEKTVREGLYDKIDQGTAPNDPFVKAYRSLADDIYATANEAGVVGSYVDNYITHMYDFGKQAKSETVQALYKLAEESGRRMGSGMSSKSPYARQRTFQTLDEAAKEMGLVPLTKDPVEVFNVYANSMLKAVNNKRLIGDLEGIKNPDTGQPMIISRPKEGEAAPRDYTTVDNPQFYNKMVHKDIADHMNSMFEAYRPSEVARAAHSLSILAKTAVFALSGFHIKSLADVMIGTARGKNIITDQKALMEQWKNGKGGDVVEQLLKGGLEIGHSTLDLNPGVFKGLVKDAGTGLDKIIPGLGEAVRLPAKAPQMLTDFLWKVVHPSFKLALGTQEYGRLVAKGVEPELAAELAATFTNDALGGLNWRRLALDAETAVGESIANTVASKRGQAYMQVALLAPDWTVATARTWLGAIRKGKSPEEKMMYAKYLAQSALAYATVADILNMHFSGHHFWENEDPTYVDLGDGRKMQLSKHFMEGIHWMTDPDKTLANKLGTIPAEVYSQLSNQDYISAKGAPKIVEDEKNPLDPEPLMQRKLKNTAKRAEHVLERFVPITGQAFNEQPWESALSGFVGLPVYGRSEEQKMEEKLKKMMEKYD